MTDDADSDRVGLGGRADDMGEGDAKPDADRPRGMLAPASSIPDVVLALFEPTTMMAEGRWTRVDGGPWYADPSSPGAKDRAEQKPSDEDISRVRPSPDLAESVSASMKMIDDLNLPAQICECREVQIAYDT